MKPFNLDLALKGHPVVTRNGKNVTELHLFKHENLKYPLTACVGGELNQYSTQGEFINNSYHDEDLFMSETNVDRYFNVYFNEKINHMWINTEHKTWQDAQDAVSDDLRHFFLKTIKVTNQI